MLQALKQQGEEQGAVLRELVNRGLFARGTRSAWFWSWFTGYP
jgi:hypothetical protein